MRTHPIRARRSVVVFTLASLAGAALTGPAIAQFDPSVSGARWPRNAPRPLPYFDVRLKADGLQQDWVLDALAAARSPQALEARARDAQALRDAIPQLRIDDNEFFGTPHWIASTFQFLTPPVVDGALAGRQVVRDFVAAHPGLFEIDAGELDVARMERDFFTDSNGARHLTFQQQIGEVDLYGCELKANVTRNGELLNVSSSMLPRPSSGFETAAIALTPLAAIRAAAGDIGARVTTNPAPLSTPQGPQQRQVWGTTPDFRPEEPITSELVWFPLTRTQIHPAWLVLLPEIGVGNTYEIMVDATDGQILRRWNRLHFALTSTQDATYRVYVHDSPAPGTPGNATPNQFQFPLEARQLVTIVAGSTPESQNGWIDDGVNETQGNNVDAHLDLNFDNNPDLPRPAGSPFRVFDFPQDNLQDPTLWQNAAVTNLFYLCNRFHDRLYQLGFNEVAKNFQATNFTGLGTGNDRVQADAQDGSGTDNANFNTGGADGSVSRMQMYVFVGPTPHRDGDVDADIVYHEHGHGVSIRLHNGTVSGSQSGGMGEGWSDFWGLSMNAEAGDNPNATYVTGGYTTYQFISAGFVDNYYFGIRRFPYSTDLNKAPQTYADIATATQSYPPGIPISPVIPSTANEVHNVGEVWCEMLNEVRANLWANYGFAGNARLQQLVLDGMKLDPSNPNFLQARDGILQADINDYGGVDLQAIWAGFAKRGAGFSATSPSGSSTSGIIEAYDMPSFMVFNYPNGLPTQLAPGQPRTFQVQISGVGGATPTPGTGQLFFSSNGGSFAPLLMSQTSPNNYDATLPAGSCLDVVRYYVSTTTSAGTANDPNNAPTATRTATVYTDVATSFTDDFQADQGWVASFVSATTGFWQRGTPVTSPSIPSNCPAVDGDGSGQCYLTQNQSGNFDVDGGSVTLTSPVFDMSGGADVTYLYWYSSSTVNTTDKLLLEINNNGGAGAWTPLWSTSTSSALWRTNTVSAAQIAALGVTFTSTMKVRFTANDGGTANVVEAGLDGFKLSKLNCSGPIGTNFCAGDGTAGACPCGNSGVPGNGCENSGGTGGARLGALGTTSPDTLKFFVTGEMPTGLTILLQGPTLISPAPFGDGLRCTGGILKRMYARAAVGGQVIAPTSGDPSVSALSASLGDVIAPGTTRLYQTYYRDPDPVFCPPAAGNTWNSSNGVSINW